MLVSDKFIFQIVGFFVALMANIGAFTCLAAGLKALRPKLGLAVVFALLFVSLSSLPIFIDHLQGIEYLAPPISLWGFFMNFVFWTSETLILAGVSQIVWGYRKKEMRARVHLLPSEKSRQQILLWSVSFAVVVFGFHVGSQIWLKSVFHSSHSGPLPILPLAFYFFAFVPLLIIDRQVGMWVAIRQVFPSTKANLFIMLKLAFTAEAIFLTISVLMIMLQHAIMDTYLISKSVFADQVITVIYAAAIGIINSAMMAVAFAEIYGLAEE